MRKHRHLPQFTKQRNGNKDSRKSLGRRAHGLTPREAPAASVLASAEKRRRLYLNSCALRRSGLVNWHEPRPMTGFPMEEAAE